MGTYTEANVVEQTWTILRDYGQTAAEQLLTNVEIIRLLRTAERIYSGVRPRTLLEDLAGNGTHFLAVPTDWEEGFSSIVSVESPPDVVPPQTIDARTVRVDYDADEALRLVFESAPATGAVVRLAYTKSRAYATTAQDTTVLDADHFAVCDLTASICADAIAGKYARSSEPVVGADVAGFRSRVQEWQSIAKRHFERWQSAMGIAHDGAGGPAASAWANWDTRSSWGGMHLTHPRSVR